MALSPQRRFRRWAPATAAYWCVLLAAMHVPLEHDEREPRWFDFASPDKLVHVVLYAGFGFLLTMTLDARGVARSGRRAFALAAAYGVLDELTQPLTGRTCDVKDYAADLVGIAIGVAVALRWVSRP